MTQHRILFVCLGNVSRSPLAEAAMRRLIAQEDRLDDFLLDSAGIIGDCAGMPPDPRACAAAAALGIDLKGEKARAVAPSDFKSFNVLLAMDSAGRDALRAMAPDGTAQRVHRLLDFSPWIGVKDVPDPAAGSTDDFADVFDLIQLALRGLLLALDRADQELVTPEVPRERLKVSSAR